LWYKELSERGVLRKLKMRGRTSSSLISILLVSATLLVANTGRAHAYIDPGTGSIIIQALLAIFFGSLFAIKIFWKRITGGLSTFRARFLTRETP
jgi:hypothetical protein